MQRIMLLMLLTAVNGYAQIISEICPSNNQVLEIGFDRFPDWIEIYNDTEEPIELVGYAITDDPDDLTKWSFITGSIPAEDFKIVSAEKNSPDPTVISFSFNKKGETIYLVNPEGLIIDSVAFPRMETDNSYGRIDGEWYFFDAPTPGLFNWLETGYKGYATLPAFSRPSGHYPIGTEVHIYSGNYDESVFYSLNGTNPLECELYSEPFTLTETMTLTTVAKGDSLIDSQPVSKTYFVGSSSHHLPIVNLCIDSLALFDETTGICMPGPDADDEFPYSGANFWGSEKVDVWFQYFDEDFHLIEELSAELKIHGGSGSRTRPMKSFQIRAKNGTFEHFYFEEKYIHNLERILLRNGGNDFCNTCVKDGVLHNYFIDHDLNVDLLAFSPTIVYINGNYHGIQNIREKVDRYYLEANHGVDPESVNILEGIDLLEVEGDKAGFEEIIDYVLSNDLSDSVHYEWVNARVDLNSMVDYFIIELYLNNRDWPNNNLKLWNSPEQPLWRYICYDLDAAFRYVTESLEDRESLLYILENFVETNPHVSLFNALLENDSFRNYFINRYADLMNTVLKPDPMFDSFMGTKAAVEHDMSVHYEKWCGVISEWDERFVGTYGFVYSRQDIVYNELVSVFSQNGEANIVVDTYPYNAGAVKLNTLNLEAFPFAGRYLDGTSITLEAIPIEEGNFTYWQNARTGERFYDTRLEVNPVEGDRYVAVFSFEEKVFDLTVIPNPVKDMANIRFSLPDQSNVKLIVTDSRGNFVQEIVDLNELPTGNHFFTWNVEGLEAGVYNVIIMTDYKREWTRLVKL